MALDEVAVLVPVELDALCKLTHELCEPDVQEIWPLPRIPQGGIPGSEIFPCKWVHCRRPALCHRRHHSQGEQGRLQPCGVPRLPGRGSYN